MNYTLKKSKSEASLPINERCSLHRMIEKRLNLPLKMNKLGNFNNFTRNMC